VAASLFTQAYISQPIDYSSVGTRCLRMRTGMVRNPLLSDHCWDLDAVVFLKFCQEYFLVLQGQAGLAFPASKVLSLPSSDGI